MVDKKIRNKKSRYHKMKLSNIFGILVTLLVCVSGSFPYYDQFALTTTSCLYQYFDVEDPVKYKIAWWGSFLASPGGPIRWIEKMQDTCDACKADHKDPENTDCEDGIFDLVTGAIQNVVTGTMGWNSGLRLNNALFDGHLNKRNFVLLAAVLIVWVAYIWD
ncbi:hypothetical protein TPHA_0B00120 [Tetrapisispora phaffii CBS 4417]|uniref:Uncharacterized protein n=1 Tax=Tetrapisispora phaffii (strain ATCC 24235 / CBS 4417 / NBRC 1672 / NRRL Y-8282 / UCD 70-5) TaxID=1071381 RepID=G8BQ87_TETPH|nr:hypothetical protein TPHA_0B00120 [Tetrapisispora phaffii CBS 4417]CCE61684.1 hypothetical protein TPHA_0B00120 [Tetrapisispora phaffii CBS 4417]